MSRLGRWLRTLADRLDPHGAPRFIGWSFTFEPGVGIRFRADGRGCRLWHLGNADYERAHSEADTYDVARAAWAEAERAHSEADTYDVARAAWAEAERALTA